MQKRRRFRQTEALENRLAAEAKKLRTKAATLPHGIERERLLRKAEQDETAAHLTEWLNSPGLKAPT